MPYKDITKRRASRRKYRLEHLVERQQYDRTYGAKRKRANRAAINRWHRERRARRRAKWLAENGPCKCGSWDKLECHHLDPTTKVDHRVWWWGEKRMLVELAKCIPLCDGCHKVETLEQRARMTWTHRDKIKVKHRDPELEKEEIDAVLDERIDDPIKDDRQVVSGSNR